LRKVVESAVKCLTLSCPEMGLPMGLAPSRLWVAYIRWLQKGRFQPFNSYGRFGTDAFL